MLGRRLVTVPLFLALTLALTVLAPLLAVAALLLTPIPATRGALPTTGFILGYLWCETAGIIRAFAILIRHRDHEAFLRANFDLQCWWARTLTVIGKRLFRLQYHATGEEALLGPAAIMLPRHTSIADTVLPMTYYAIPQQIRLRYVLKQELLVDPCLDIVGNRLPNYFVDRHGQDSDGARRGVVNMMTNLAPFEGALIYPEGTRYSAARHVALTTRYQSSPDMLEQLERWPYLLPPRLGGTLAMLSANPGRDLIFLAHTGFEGSTHFSNLINGSWIGAQIRLKFWRVPFHDIPASPDAQRDFLFSQWDQMNAAVEELGASCESR